MKALSSGRRALLPHLGHLTCPFSCSRMVKVSVTSRSHLSQRYSYAGITTPPADWGAEGGSAPVAMQGPQFALAARRPVVYPAGLPHGFHRFIDGHQRRRLDRRHSAARRRGHREGCRADIVLELTDQDDVILAEREPSPLDLPSEFLDDRSHGVETVLWALDHP